MLNAYRPFTAHCQRIGSLELNLDKGKLIFFHKKGLDDDLIGEAKKLFLKIKTKSVKILGAPVGMDKKFVSDLAVEITTKYKVMFDRLKNEKLPDYVTDQILRMCGTPSLNYLARVVPPTYLREASLLFDNWTRETFSTKHKISSENLPSWVWEQLSLPMRSGGMSLRQYTVTGRLPSWASFACA